MVSLNYIKFNIEVHVIEIIVHDFGLITLTDISVAWHVVCS